MAAMKRVALYVRVSTSDQSCENQLIALREAADRAGWIVVQEYADEGISGSTGRDKRPAFDQMCKAITRRKFDMVAAWHVDRLGRSLGHLCSFLAELEAAGVDLFLHEQALDTTTPGGRALFQLLGVFGEFEKSMIVERVRAGLVRAKKNGKKLGRPRVTSYRLREEVLERRMAGESMRSIGRTLGVSEGTVRNVVRAAS